MATGSMMISDHLYIKMQEAASMREPCNQTDQCSGDRRGYLASCDDCNQANDPQHQDWKRGQLW